MTDRSCTITEVLEAFLILYAVWFVGRSAWYLRFRYSIDMARIRERLGPGQ